MQAQGHSRAPWVALGVVAAVGLVPFFVSWSSSARVHTLLEVAATLAVLLASVVVMGAYYRSREAWLSVLGVGLWGTALLDAYHAVATSPHFAPLFSSQPRLIAWSWLASRLLLSVVLLHALRVRASGKVVEGRGSGAAWATTGSLTLAVFLAFVWIPLPPAHVPEQLLGRPQELLPAALFGWALVWVLRRGAWRTEGFDRWLTVALILLTASQALLMTRSRQVFDAPFDLGHGLKLIAHGLLLLAALRVPPLTRACEREELANEIAQDLPRSIAWQFGLVLIALLAAAGTTYSISTRRSAFHEAVPGMINRTGRQRLLLSELHRELEQRPLRSAELTTLLDQLHGHHERQLRISARLDTSAVAGPLELLNGPLEAFLEEVRRANAKDARAASELARRVPGLIRLTDDSVEAIEAYSEAQARRTDRLQLLLLVVTGLLLCGLALFVVWPLLLRLRRNLGALRQLLADTEAVRDGLDVELRRLFQLSGDLISVADLESGRLLRVNPAFERTLGFSSAEFLAQPFSDFIHPDDLEGTRAQVQRLLSGEPSASFENRYRTKAGGWRWLSWNVAPSSGALVYAVARDVTDMRHARKLLEFRALELERSNKALDDFSYVASHDLRAPLRDIANLSQWIQEDVGDDLPPDSRKHLETLVSRVHRMEALLEDLLQYSRAGRKLSAPEEIDLGEFFATLREILAVPEGFEVVLPASGPTISSPHAPLDMVLRNLIQNAIKHHDRDQGAVTVTLQDKDEAWLELAVSDDGPGIPPKFHERVFRLFQTLRPRDELEASGMGLAIVKKQVESHGGVISIESIEGRRGTTFRFTWPKNWLPPEEGPSHG